MTSDALGGVLRLVADERNLTPEKLTAIAKVVDANQEAIQLYKKAAAYPYLRRDLNFAAGVEAIIPPVGDFRAGARLLAGEAIAAAENGDARKTAEAIGAIFQMAVHLAEEPTLISQLTRTAMESIGIIALEIVGDRIELPPSALAKLQNHLVASETAIRLEEAFETEVVVGRWTFAQISQESEPLILDGQTKGNDNASTDVTSGLLDRDERFYLTQAVRSNESRSVDYWLGVSAGFSSVSSSNSSISFRKNWASASAGRISSA